MDKQTYIESFRFKRAKRTIGLLAIHFTLMAMGHLTLLDFHEYLQEEGSPAMFLGGLFELYGREFTVGVIAIKVAMAL